MGSNNQRRKNNQSGVFDHCRDYQGEFSDTT